jgi:two-component system chemotaxis response regulator CheY
MSAGASILIVDDDVVLARAFSLALQGAGYRPRPAHSAEEALRQLASAPPDAIILDFRMPLINGVGFLYRLRSQPQYEHTPVLVVTGETWLTEEVREELRGLGAEVRLKPIGLDDLLEWTRELVAAGRPMAQMSATTPDATPGPAH